MKFASLPVMLNSLRYWGFLNNVRSLWDWFLWPNFAASIFWPTEFRTENVSQVREASLILKSDSAFPNSENQSGASLSDSLAAICRLLEVPTPDKIFLGRLVETLARVESSPYEKNALL